MPKPLKPKPEKFEFGGVIGIAEIVDGIEDHRSSWFSGEGYGWVLANPRRLPFRTCKGQLGMFKPMFA